MALRYTKLKLLQLGHCAAESSSDAWDCIVSTIDPLVYLELCSLAIPEDVKRRRRNVDRCNRSGGDVTRRNHFQSGDLSEHSLSIPESDSCYAGELLTPGEQYMEEDYEDSDDGGSLQPLAFYVEGEPDFDSGPPQDGFEYLRRVMWEAARCPKVVTAKVPKRSEQTPYMPEIPPVPLCSSELLPSKDWRRAFLEDFSHLRTSFSWYALESREFCCDMQQPFPPISNKALWKSFCFPSTAKVPELDECIDEKINRSAISTTMEENCFADKDGGFRGVAADLAANSPFIGILLRLDEVSIATLFRYHVSWLREQQRLSYEQALWLFSLAVAVDLPLDDQTSSSFRELLRKCAEWRMDKQPEDDELFMLNILIIIAGDYFGQDEHRGM